jgi:hypothetical protein
MGASPAELAAAKTRLRELADEAGRAEPEIVTFSSFDPREPERVPEQLGALREAGVARLVAGARYADLGEFARHVAFLAERGAPRALVGGSSCRSLSFGRRSG